MSDVAIRAEGLGKQYRIGSPPERYKTLRDKLTDSAARPFRLLLGRGGRAHLERRTIWALRDVSFEITRGEVVGVIGRNGAGKSTLLKILSRITKPTTGHAEIRGRVGSLLEVGTGFHAELTGRENIYLNGAIMGMRKAEIENKFDEIVAFAEVGPFIDTPVKHFSSGMYLRLAFAVAAHLEPEILIVDEVLAVGDAEFQKRCLGKIGSVARSGRTVLFVSHYMAAVRTLCSRAILLQQGQVSQDTPDVDGAIASYNGLVGTGTAWQRDLNGVPAEAAAVFTSLESRLVGEQPNCVLELRGELRSLRPHPPAFFAFDIVDAMSVPLMQALPHPDPFIPYSETPHRFFVSITLPPLVPNTYHVHAWLGSHYLRTLDFVHSPLAFTIPASPTPGRTFPHTPDHGFVVPQSTAVLDTAKEPTCAG